MGQRSRCQQHSFEVGYDWFVAHRASSFILQSITSLSVVHFFKQCLFDTDTPGDVSSCWDLMKTHFSLAHIVLVGFDVTNRTSFDSCVKRIDRLRKEDVFDGVTIAVGNKIDLGEQRVITSDDARNSFASMNPPVAYFETSAKSGEGVNSVFESAVKEVLAECPLSGNVETVKRVVESKEVETLLEEPQTFFSSLFSWLNRSPSKEPTPAPESEAKTEPAITRSVSSSAADISSTSALKTNSDSNLQQDSADEEANKKPKFALPSSYTFEKLLEQPCCSALKTKIYNIFKVFKSVTKGDTDTEIRTVHGLLRNVEKDMKKLDPWMNIPRTHFNLAKEQMVKFVFKNLYQTLFVKKEYQLKDTDIRKHFDVIRPYVTPAFLDLKEELVKNEVIPTAISILSEIDEFQSPSEKLACLFGACRVLSYILSNGGNDGGADVFLSLLIYVVVNTPLQSLHSDLQFIQHYVDEDEKASESFCFFAHFCSAVSFLEKQTVESISSTINERGKSQEEQTESTETEAT